MTLQFILKSIYVCTIGLAFVSSLVVFLKPQQPVHLKVFSILLGITLFVELWASRLVMFFPFKSNFTIYYFFFPVEIIAYAWFFLRIIESRALRKLVKWLVLLFLLYWLGILAFAFKVKEWNSYVFILGYSICIFLSVIYFYEVMQSEKPVRLHRQTEFWIAAGMLLFYLCFLPYFGALNFLNKNSWVFSRSLLNVSIVADTFMYISFTYSFLCRIPNGK